MQRIGFVGLGVMGAPMAHCLLKRGFSVAAHDLRSEAVDQAVTQGASEARDLQDLVECDAIIVMVNTDAQARHVIGTLISLLNCGMLYRVMLSFVCLATSSKYAYTPSWLSL